MRRDRKRRNHLHGVAPDQIIREDFLRLNAVETLRTTAQVEELILMQSVVGHANEGGGMFHGRKFPNTNMEEIATALRRAPNEVATERQDLISDISDWAKRALSATSPQLLLNDEGEPLLGMGMFRERKVVPQDVLRGLFLGGSRDAPPARRAVEQAYGIKMGYGVSYPVDQAVMHRMGLNGDLLAHGDHENEIGHFRSQGLLVDDPGSKSKDAPNGGTGATLRYMYIRHRQAPGASDDAAVLAGGFLYNLDVALGVFLADAIDTLEKFVPRYSDQDSDLAEIIKGGFPQLAVSEEEVIRLTALSAIPQDLEGKIPDSSLRHFLRVDREVDQTALESHLQFIQGKPFAPMRLAMEAVPSEEFYEWFQTRLKDFKSREAQ